MKYEEVKARDLACRLRSLDMESASATVGDMITEIDRLRKALGEIAECGSCFRCLECNRIARKALDPK